MIVSDSDNKPAVKKLLIHQYELIKDNQTKILGLVSGYGAGKTYAVARKAIVLMSLNAGCDGVITEPTYPMLADILIPEMCAALEEYGIPYRFNKAGNVFTCQINGQETRILCRSMENYERLVGVNAAWVIMDEADTAKAEIAYNAYIKLMARIRAGNVRQIVIVSTPEGYRMMHRVFVKEFDPLTKRLIRANSNDNKYLPPDYLKTLIGIYPEELQKAYISGQFVNMTSGTVYNAFDRDTCACTTEIEPGEPLYIGQDFNVGNMASVVYVRRGNEWHIVGEIKKVLDTPELMLQIKEMYPNRDITFYPDASGKNRTTKGASTSDIKIIQEAGYAIRVRKKNPLIKDRVLSVNSAFKRGLLKVNIANCPQVVECLEQQAYDANGQPDKSSGHDHMLDGLGYLVSYEMPVSRPVIAPVVAQGMF